MGKPSLIVVDDIEFEEKLSEKGEKVAKVSFDLLGRVEIDQEETITLENEFDT